MRKTLLVLGGMLSIAAIACSQDDDQPQKNDYQPIVLSEKSASMIKANNDFGFNLLKSINTNAGSTTNVFISPLSVSQALSMTLNGAAGTTASEMATVLGYQQGDVDQVNASSRLVREALLKADNQVDISIANSIWYRDEYQAKPAFVDNCTNHYAAEVNKLDFSNGDAAKMLINNWVDDKTNSKIPSIIEKVKSEDVMFLINAIYFKGAWQYRFDKNNTTTRSFTNSSGQTIDVNMMTQRAGLGYMAADNFSAVELPYGNGHFSMVVMLPALNSSVETLLNSFNSDMWADAMNGFAKRDVQVYLPKFKIECTFKLNETLQQMGMPRAFTGLAEFPNLLNGNDFCITEVRHKTFVEVGEEGTEAAAVTSVTVGFTSVGPDFKPQPIQFVVDRPFVFAIREKDTGSILFIGKVVGGF
jgi:serpin B